jgi:DNA invertase Pin-like site-specific DNA recombinase
MSSAPSTSLFSGKTGGIVLPPPTPSDSRKVCIYCRVSTNMQHSGLEAQERALREYCSKRDISDYLVFQDENFSGTKSSRPALDTMMKAVRDGAISTVIVYSFSRFARSTTHLLTALEEFKKRNVAFVSTTEAIDTNSPLGTAFFTILACLAQLERDLIVERVRTGLANARAKGKHIGRIKTRPSELIRSLLKSGMTLRAYVDKEVMRSSVIYLIIYWAFNRINSA